MKILLLGKNGQLGWELQRSLAPLGELVALDRQGAPGLCGDLGEPDGLAATVRALRPDVIQGALHLAIPGPALDAMPYILTVIVLAGFVGKAIPPRAGGQPYVKER